MRLMRGDDHGGLAFMAISVMGFLPAYWVSGGAFRPLSSPLVPVWIGFLFIAIYNAQWGLFALIVYTNRQIAERMVAGLRSTELRRIKVRAEETAARP